MTGLNIIESISKKLGIREYLAYFYNNFFVKHYPLFIPDSRKLIKANIEKINFVTDILFDEKSKHIFREEIDNRINMMANFKSIREGNEYLINELFENINKSSEVIIDAGAYRGDTVRKFINYFGDKCNTLKIYAFEADPKNVTILSKNISKWNYNSKVSIMPYAIYDSNRKLKFKACGAVSSKVSENTDIDANCTVVEAVRLDDVISEKITFIKMDIEGSEIQALRGAERIIKMYRPKLAICLYHKPDDIWEIPILVHKLLPEYKLYVRHHEYDWNESVLYARV